MSAYTTRTPVDRNVASFMAIDANVAYALDTGGNLWRDGLPAGGHTKIDGNVKAFQPIPGDYYVYVLGADGNLWFEPNGIAGRTFVAGGVQAFQAMGIGFVYWKDAPNNLWYQVANAAPTLVGDRPNVNTFHAASQSAIYVLGSDAKLWNENGDYTHRSLVEPNVLAYAPVDGTNVYVEETDAALWNEAGVLEQSLPGGLERPLRFAPIDDNYLLVEGGDGKPLARGARLELPRPRRRQRESLQPHRHDGRVGARQRREPLARGAPRRTTRVHGDPFERLVDNRYLADGPVHD